MSISRVASKKIAIVLGTRPEMVKVKPVISALTKYKNEFRCKLINTGQHIDLLKSFGMDVIGSEERIDLDFLRVPSGHLAESAFNEVRQLMEVISREAPDMLVVQGDTTSGFAAALAAYYARIPVGHIEAGLRTNDPNDPFPEEANRRFITTVASLHFAPTPHAKENLILEGIPRDLIYVTGNTGIDAMLDVLREHNIDPSDPSFINKRKEAKTVLITTHRRENLARLSFILGAVKETALAFSDHKFIFPMHPNPIIRDQARQVLEGMKNVSLVEPMRYGTFIKKLAHAKLMLTDSGGIQEEAAHLGVPTLILREKTERPEGVTAGVARIVGTDPRNIFSTAHSILSNPEVWEEMARPWVLYGDGKASFRVVQAMRRHFGFSSEKPTQFFPLHSHTISGDRAGIIRPSAFTVEESVRFGADWLLDSGIQSMSKDMTLRGGVYSWFDETTGSYPFLYSEITGYFISASLYLREKWGDASFLERGKLAALWLMRNALNTNNNLVLTRFYEDDAQASLSSAYSFGGGIAYSFDNGMVVNGLMNLFSVLNQPAYLMTAQGIADSLINKLQMSNGLFQATYSIVSGRPVDDVKVWSRHPGSHHSKLIIGLMDLFRTTGDKKYLDSAVLVGNAALVYQHDNGRFEVFRRDRDTYTHYHIYSAEGLIYGALPSFTGGEPLLDEATAQKWISSGKKAFDWLLHTQYICETGGISKSYINKTPTGIETSDIIAQTLRLGSLFRSLGMVSASQEQRIRFLVDRLMSYQSRREERNSFGGFYYGFDDSNEFIPHVNSWSTMFAVQALDMFDRAFNKGEKLTMRNFI